MRKIFLVLLLLLSLSGCAPRMTPIEAEAKYGRLPDNYKELIMAYMEPRLKEPGSGKYTFPGPFPPEPRDDCWSVSFWLNGKNSFGGYTGNRLAVCLIANGQVINCASK